MLLLLILMSGLMGGPSSSAAAAVNFNKDVEITWGGNERAKIYEGGQLIALSLDRSSGSGFKSKNEYLFGRFDMQLKLIPGNSAGTATTYYLSSQGSAHDEIDFEFLGNEPGQPYTVSTNVYAHGTGSREQQFHLWFDPTTSFHTYTIIWNSQCIIFLVDNIPIRVFNNNEALGVPFPNRQPMRIYSTVWNADDWATKGGTIKINWAHSPFIASYRNLDVNACVYQSSGCGRKSEWKTQKLGATESKKLAWVKHKFLTYNYCADLKRFPQGIPPECRRSKFTLV